MTLFPLLPSLWEARLASLLGFASGSWAHAGGRLGWWREWFGFSQLEALTLDHLYRQPGSAVPREALRDAVGVSEIRLVSVLQEIEDGLNPGGLHIGPDEVRLSAAGILECDAALSRRDRS